MTGRGLEASNRVPHLRRSVNGVGLIPALRPGLLTVGPSGLTFCLTYLLALRASDSVGHLCASSETVMPAADSICSAGLSAERSVPRVGIIANCARMGGREPRRGDSK